MTRALDRHGFARKATLPTYRACQQAQKRFEPMDPEWQEDIAAFVHDVLAEIGSRPGPRWWRMEPRRRRSPMATRNVQWVYDYRRRLPVVSLVDFDVD
jgi:hypothetical protein